MANKKKTPSATPAVDTKGAASASAEEEEEDGDYSTGGRGPGGGKDYRKPKDAKGTLLRLLKYVVSNRMLLVAVLVMMLISTGANLIATYLMKPLLDEYIVPNITAAEKDWSGLAMQLTKLAIIYLLGVAANYGQSAVMTHLSQRAINKLRKDLFDKLQTLPISFYDAHTHGEIMSRFTNDADTVQMAMEMTVTTFISSILTFAGIIFMMIYLNYKLFLITLVAMFIDLFLVKKLGGHSKKMFKAQQKALGSVNAYIEEMVEGIKVVKAFNYEDRAETEFNHRNLEYHDAAVEANFFGMLLGPVLNQFMGIIYAFTTIAAGLMVLNGSVMLGGAVFTVGSMATYLTYSKQVAMPINQISNQVVNLLSAIAGAERMFNIMDNLPEVDEGTVTLVPVETGKDGKLRETTSKHQMHWAWKDGEKLTELKGHVQIEDIYFHYVAGKPVLRGVSVEALPGQKIAFVGSTGAGKTTITNLINRFYDVQQGRILYDGIDVREIAKDDLRRSLVLILQDTHLFTGTIIENIRYGRLDATDGECIEAAKTANAYNFIMQLPEGFQTRITGDGSNLSQGQRQLLNIARAAVAEPPVLIMDEATSSIDTRTEKEIEKGMDGLMKGRTVFVIAHRLSTVRNSDKIAVIEAGQIIEFGSHKELIALGGRYYELYTGQHQLE